MSSKPIKILLALVLVKSLAWMMLVPIFQVPDEPSHFAIVEFLGEHGRRPHPRRERVTPAEIMRAAEIVNFDWRINHPVWRGYPADWKERLGLLTPGLKDEVVDNPFQTSNKRPPLYYYLAAPFYLLGGDSFLGRFFAVRFLSVVLHLLTVWLAYLTAGKIFRSKRLGLAVAALVGFQPTLSFLSAGVHYDPLAILLVTGFIYFSVQSHQWQSWLTALLGILVKPDLIFLPLLKLRGRWLVSVAVILLLTLAGLHPFLEAGIAAGRTGSFDRWLYLVNLNEYTQQAQLLLTNLVNGRLLLEWKNYFTATAAIHWAQVFPWYWGTFGWVEAPLPGAVFTVIKLVTGISCLGWIKYIHHHGFPRRLWFIFSLTAMQAAVVVLNDFLFFSSRGEVYGIQGRYFLPAIAAQMILLVFGLRQWLGEKLLANALIILSLGLNLIGLATAYQYFGNVWR